MRETKEQKMARLERVVDEQKKELIELRKERKSLNYKVSSLKKLADDRDRCTGELKSALKSSEAKVDCAVRENEKLKKQLSDIKAKLDEADYQNEDLQAKVRGIQAEYDDAVERYEKAIERLNMRINQLENTGVGDIRRTIQNIAAIKSDAMINEVARSQFQNGELYYDSTIFYLTGVKAGANIDENNLLEKCKTGKKPFFDPEDLIIRINPKTGIELDESAISYIKAILDDEPDYDLALIDVGDYGCFHDGEELDAFVYSKGMALLGLYEDRVF